MTDKPSFGLYVHWPFCQAKCPYCDFNSHVTEQIDQARWADALAAEIAYWGATTRDRTLDTVFFGGGTPSLMDAESVATVLDTVARTWSLASDLEVTLEANPTSVEMGRFEEYRTAGVNRISLGIQALNDEDLKRLGRLHSAADARRALALAQRMFDRTSFDLICARQDQSLDAWKAELDLALSLAGDHLSLYQLTIEPGTAFHRRFEAGGLQGLPEDDLSADMYEATVETCAAAGLTRYEVSNFARPGEECRHNLIYWTGGDYIGIGPGAHGRVTRGNGRLATEQEPLPGKWLSETLLPKRPHERSYMLTRKDVINERLMMGLRLKAGLDLSQLDLLTSEKINIYQSIKDLEKNGLVVLENDQLAATNQGMLLLNTLLTDLILE